LDQSEKMQQKMCETIRISSDDNQRFQSKQRQEDATGRWIRENEFVCKAELLKDPSSESSNSSDFFFAYKTICVNCVLSFA